jgi:hypothetical protein
MRALPSIFSETRRRGFAAAAFLVVVFGFAMLLVVQAIKIQEPGRTELVSGIDSTESGD